MLQLGGVEAGRLPTSASSRTNASSSLSPPFTTLLLLPTLLRWRRRVFRTPLLGVGVHWGYWRRALALLVFLFRVLLRNPLELFKACWGSRSETESDAPAPQRR